MRAWLLESIGGVDKLKIASVPDPLAAPGHVVVDVKYAALNPADRYLAEGLYPAKPALPHILGRDGVGVISAVGTGDAGGFKVGDTVLLLRGEVGINVPGMFAQKCAIPVDSLVARPAGWTDEECAGATLVYLTALQALTQWGELPPSVVLVTGASGGVGMATTQLGMAMGHTIIALSRSAAKQARLRETGAALALDPADPQWKKAVKEFLAPRRKRVDLAVDNIGGALFNDVLDTLGESGRISVVGRLAGPVPQFNTASLIFRRARIGGVHVGSYDRNEAHAAWETSLKLLAKTGAKPLVDRIFSFEDLRPAFDRLAAGPMGKVLLRVG